MVSRGRKAEAGICTPTAAGPLWAQPELRVPVSSQWGTDASKVSSVFMLGASQRPRLAVRGSGAQADLYPLGNGGSARWGWEGLGNHEDSGPSSRGFAAT